MNSDCTGPHPTVENAEAAEAPQQATEPEQELLDYGASSPVPEPQEAPQQAVEPEQELLYYGASSPEPQPVP